MEATRIVPLSGSTAGLPIGLSTENVLVHSVPADAIRPHRLTIHAQADLSCRLILFFTSGDKTAKMTFPLIYGQGPRPMLDAMPLAAGVIVTACLDGGMGSAIGRVEFEELR